MKNKYFNLENFIEFHKSILHSIQEEKLTNYDRDLNWQLQQAYEYGWSACLEELEKDMNDTFTEDTLVKMIDEMTKETKCPHGFTDSDDCPDCRH